MRKRLLMTDVTEMHEGRVCIAGLDSQGNTIRPVLPGGVYLWHLYREGHPAIVPRAVVELDLRPVADAVPPHVEDMAFDPTTVRFCGARPPAQMEKLLLRSAHDTVTRLYAGQLREGRWVLPGSLTVSLGTLAGPRPDDVVLGRVRDGRAEYRLSFTDTGGESYPRISIADLAFRRMADAEVARLGDPQAAAERIVGLLRQADSLYVRLGLTRPYAPVASQQKVCWMQVTGILSFPDYLGGRCFADFGGPVLARR